MTNNIEQYKGGAGLPAQSAKGLAARRLQKHLAMKQGEVIVRTADVVAESAISLQKMREVDHLAREAITGQIMLARWADSLAGSDPLLHDEVKLFRDIARMGKAQIISDLVDGYARESFRNGM